MVLTYYFHSVNCWTATRHYNFDHYVIAWTICKESSQWSGTCLRTSRRNSTTRRTGGGPGWRSSRITEVNLYRAWSVCQCVSEVTNNDVVIRTVAVGRSANTSWIYRDILGSKAAVLSRVPYESCDVWIKNYSRSNRDKYQDQCCNDRRNRRSRLEGSLSCFPLQPLLLPKLIVVCWYINVP